MSEPILNYTVRDETGRVIGCGTGTRAWIEKQVADMKARDMLPGSDATVSRERPEWLTVFEGGGRSERAGESVAITIGDDGPAP